MAFTVPSAHSPVLVTASYNGCLRLILNNPAALALYKGAL